MPGAPFWWFACMTSRTVSGRSLFMAFVMVPPWRWLLHKPALATIFGFFPMVFQTQPTLEIMSAWLRISLVPPTL